MARSLLALSALVLGACRCGAAGTPLGDVPRIIVHQRAPLKNASVTAIAGEVSQPITWQPPGNLYVLEPAAPDGVLTPLVTEKSLGKPLATVDVVHPSLDWDAKRVVFSMKVDEQARWHLYAVGVDGSGLAQLTSGDQDDLDPTWLADGRIVFTSTEAGELDESERRPSTLLTVMNADGSGRRRIDHNLSHARAPTLLASGQILYTRWENHGPVDRFSLFAQSPDRGDAVIWFGRHGEGLEHPNSWLWPHEREDGKVVAVAMPRRGTWDAGALMLLDRNLGEDQGAVNLTPDVPVWAPPGRTLCSPAGRYRDPWPLGGDRYLVSWAPGCVSAETAQSGSFPDFGIYVYDAKTQKNLPVWNDPHAWELTPIPVRPRTAPRVIPPAASQGADDVFLAGALDLFDSGTPFDPLLAGSALTVRLVEGMSNAVVQAPSAGHTDYEPKAILGEVPVFEDGSFIAALPARTAIHVQPLDEFGLSLRNETSWFYGLPGEARFCGGCHEKRTADTPAGSQSLASAAYRADPAPFQRHEPVPQRREIDFRTDIQNVLDQKCATAGCHDARAAAGGYGSMAGQVMGLDLDGVTQGEFTAAYNSLTFADRVVLPDGSISTARDIWVTAGSARDSRLVRRLNVRSRAAPGIWAFSGKPHPEDVTGGAVTLGDDERAALAAWVDLGATFYTRKNATPQPRVWQAWTFDAQVFETAVEPFLIQNCATGGCHGYVPARDKDQLLFNLIPDPTSAGDHEENLRAAADWSNPAKPDDSYLLMKPLAGVAAHNGGDLFATTNDSGYRLLRSWIATAIKR